MEEIRFFVHGVPATAGSKRGMPIYRGKKGAKEFTGHVAVVDSSGQRGKEWRTDVKNAARKAYSGPLLNGPLRLDLGFSFARPKNHYGSGRNARTLKNSAPDRHVVKPDVLKLARAVEDALTGIVWVDDSQITHEVLSKGYAVGPTGSGCVITITPKEPTPQEGDKI